MKYLILALALTGCGVLDRALDNSEPEAAKISSINDSIPADTVRILYPDPHPPTP